MNFDDAVKAHAEWKMKLSNYIRSPDKSLDANVVCKDDQCALGKWIYGEGKTHSALTEYSTLKTEHAKFHNAAADIIRKADAGQNMNDQIVFGSDSDYAKSSASVVSAIMAMKKKA